MPACASTRWGRSSTPINVARALAPPITRFENTPFHAGYARYFTPPVLVEAAPVNFNLFNNTTGAVTNPIGNPLLPERAHYFDGAHDQKIVFGCTSTGSRQCTTLDLGIDAYYK